jgi:flagellar protein FlaG
MATPPNRLAGWGVSVKDVIVFIQTSPYLNQAVQPDTRAMAAAPAIAVPKPVTAPSGSPALPQPSAEELKGAVETINRALKQSNLSLEFSVDTGTDRTVVRMVDTSTGELIRQYPSETTLAISRGIQESQQGLLLTEKA